LVFLLYVVRELRRKQDDLKAGRKALADQMAGIDNQIAVLDTVTDAIEVHRNGGAGIG